MTSVSSTRPSGSRSGHDGPAVEFCRPCSGKFCVPCPRPAAQPVVVDGVHLLARVAGLMIFLRGRGVFPADALFYAGQFNLVLAALFFLLFWALAFAGLARVGWGNMASCWRTWPVAGLLSSIRSILLACQVVANGGQAE